MACNQDVITDAGFTPTIGAGTGRGARIGETKTLLIHRCSNGARTINGSLQSIYHLVHASYHDNLFRAIDDCSDTISVTIDIDHLTIHGNSIRPGEESVS